MAGEWLVAQLNPQAPGFWLVVSVAVTLALALLPVRWLAARRNGWWLANWLFIPYCGLVAGAISPRLMGLTPIDWVATLGPGLLILFAMLTLLVIVRAFMLWPVPEAEKDPSVKGPGAGYGSPTDRSAWRARGMWIGLGITALTTGALQFHWSFLRGAIWEMILALPKPPPTPSYWAVWLAAGLALLQIVLVRPGFLRLVYHATLLTMTSVLFLYSRNFWLCWALHALGSIILEGESLPAGLQGLRPVARAAKGANS